MDTMTYTPAKTLARLPLLLEALRNSPPQEIRYLTGNRIVQLLECEQGMYLFSRKADDAPVYVGRSAILPQRVGLNHRSTQENQAAVTKAIKDKYDLATMEEAREHLYENYVVRLLGEWDTTTRALLEIYAAMHLDTEFNSFLEH